MKVISKFLISSGRNLTLRNTATIFLLPCVLAVYFTPASHAGAPRTNLFPRLRAGQTFTYLIQYRTKKNVKTESRVVSAAGPDEAQTDARWYLHVEILDVRPQGDRAVIHARSKFQSVTSESLAASPQANQPPSKDPDENSAPKIVDFTLLPDGRIDPVTGLNELFPEQRQAWQEWLRQFAISAIFPSDGVGRGQNWKSTELEQSPSPIARLEWQKNSSYVRDEPCRPTSAAVTRSARNVAADKSNPSLPTNPSPAKNSPPQSCAVVFTRALLKQKSSPKNSTPSDFQALGLHTSGTATGANETISYISLQTGLIVRVTEDAHQFLDVLVAKADSSNQIHYNVIASSHTEILLLDTAPSAP
jgi:hypothetical protein